jgi:hypothetical protein
MKASLTWKKEKRFSKQVETESKQEQLYSYLMKQKESFQHIMLGKHVEDLTSIPISYPVQQSIQNGSKL